MKFADRPPRYPKIKKQAEKDVDGYLGQVFEDANTTKPSEPEQIRERMGSHVTRWIREKWPDE